MLVALPCGRDHDDVVLQKAKLNTGFIEYLRQKQVAGIAEYSSDGYQVSRCGFAAGGERSLLSPAGLFSVID